MRCDAARDDVSFISILTGFQICKLEIGLFFVNGLDMATTKTARPKSRPSRRTRHSKDDSDIYAALNDFTDGTVLMDPSLTLCSHRSNAIRARATVYPPSRS
jgi:hypothetical protein